MPAPSKSTPDEPKRAVLYLRMSSDRQKYSIKNQSCVLYAYAVEHGLDVVNQFCDQAKSGLTFEGRPAMRQLIELVKAGDCGFEFILTYDISRWGRFQDADESAYYEHLCTHSGVRVIYCAEAFDTYEGPISFVMKSLKRTFAAEYSRDLSQRVSDARWRLAKAGLHTGSYAPCGLRRVVISRDSHVIGTVEDGYIRREPGDRIVVRPGPKDEQAVVRRIFREFRDPNRSIAAIARGLNESASSRLKRRPWTVSMVRRVLTDERYVGNVVSRSFHRRGQVGRSRTPTQMVRHEAVFKPIVPVSHFHAAAARLGQARQLDNAALIENLKNIYAEKGKIAASLLGGRHGSPGATVYYRRFGGLFSAYRAAGIALSRNTTWVDRNKATSADRIKIMDIVAAQLQRAKHSITIDYGNAILNVDGAWEIHVRLLRARRKEGRIGWTFSLTDDHRADLLLLLRLDEAGSQMVDMYLIPTLSIRWKPKYVVMADTNNVGTDMYRIHRIADISPLARRYMADVDDCMPRFGRTSQDVIRSGFKCRQPP